MLISDWSSDVCSSDLSQIERISFCTYEEYLNYLSESDISIAPLEKFIFNDAKSNIKYLEASIVKIPSVCSPRAAFSTAIIQNETGFLCDTEEEWLEDRKNTRLNSSH